MYRRQWRPVTVSYQNRKMGIDWSSELREEVCEGQETRNVHARYYHAEVDLVIHQRYIMWYYVS